MGRRYALFLLALGAIWGPSYLFIKVGVRNLSPAALIEIRLLCAFPPLAVVAARRYGWSAILAVWFVPSERSTGWRLVGVALGLVGVAVLAGVHPAGGRLGAAGTGAIVLASISYAAANLYAGRRMTAGPAVLAATSMISAFVVLLPFALLSLPSHTPGWKPLGSAVALGLLGTALAQLLSYRMIRTYGSSRSVLVAYMLPAFALAYGAPRRAPLAQTP